MALDDATRKQAKRAAIDQANWIDANRIDWFQRATTDSQRDFVRGIYWDSQHHYDLAQTLAFLDDQEHVQATLAEVKTATKAAKDAVAAGKQLNQVLDLVRSAVDLVSGLF